MCVSAANLGEKVSRLFNDSLSSKDKKDSKPNLAGSKPPTEALDKEKRIRNETLNKTQLWFRKCQKHIRNEKRVHLKYNVRSM